jgi:hypothetical protein
MKRQGDAVVPRTVGTVFSGYCMIYDFGASKYICISGIQGM